MDLFTVQSRLLRGYLSVKHVHPIHFLILGHQALRRPNLILVRLIQRVKDLLSMALLLLYLSLSILFGLADLDLELGIFLLQDQLVFVERLVQLHD